MVLFKGPQGLRLGCWSGHVSSAWAPQPAHHTSPAPHGVPGLRVPRGLHIRWRGLSLPIILQLNDDGSFLSCLRGCGGGEGGGRLGAPASLGPEASLAQTRSPARRPLFCSRYTHTLSLQLQGLQGPAPQTPLPAAPPQTTSACRGRPRCLPRSHESPRPGIPPGQCQCPQLPQATSEQGLGCSLCGKQRGRLSCPPEGDTALDRSDRCPLPRTLLRRHLRPSPLSS